MDRETMSDQPIYGDKPQTRDLSSYWDGMSEWVARNLGEDGPATLTSLEPTPSGANGFVGESFIVELTRGRGGAKRAARYLLKRKPTRHHYFPEHDFEAEYRVQAALSAAQFAQVAPVLGYEADPSILGSPFYLIGFVPGRAVPDNPIYYREGWLADLTPDDQRAVSTSGLEALARLHSVPLEKTGADFLRRGGSGAQIEWDLAYWDRFSAVSWLSAPPGRVREGRAWLEANKPRSEELVISWGDARPGNMMFDGTRCAAIIDWDMATSGDREKDLGYLLAMDLQAQRTADAVGGSRLGGWPSRMEMVEIYEAAAGRPVDRKKLRFHRIFAAYQIACMYSRYFKLRQDLDEAAKARFTDERAPPIDLMREELEAADLPGSAT
jgi:aminoglycoside phosphotransferase (APT) family kinase protein